ncbi:PrpF domain-containing protein [Microbulbifer sp.]|uniref:PrpF domain-containing protein n=1 Tax=Microbulbifer sp. TaxID=1908541 RepID=UPI003F2CD0EC
MQEAINSDDKALAMFEAIRAYGAAEMGLIGKVEDAANRQHTPKVAFVAPPRGCTASSGKQVAAGDIDLLVRALSMGKLNHAMIWAPPPPSPAPWSIWPPEEGSATLSPSATRPEPCV